MSKRLKDRITSEHFRRLTNISGGSPTSRDMNLLEDLLEKEGADEPEFKPAESSEDFLQIACMNYMILQYPETLAFHCPNGGKRNPKEAKKFVDMGVRRGIPDIIIPAWKTVVELKVKGGRLGPDQKRMLAYFESIEWRTAVVWSYPEFIATVDKIAKQYNTP